MKLRIQDAVLGAIRHLLVDIRMEMVDIIMELPQVS